MDLGKQIELWNENEQYSQIIHAIEALEEKNRTDRSVSDIVRQAVDEYFGRKRRA